MKHKLTLFLVFIISIFAFSGCSCMGETFLSFSNNFSNGETVSPGYREVLTYTVNYQEKNDYYQKDSSLTCENLSFEYLEGSFVQELEVLSSLPVLPDNKTSDISEKLDGKSVYHLTTTFTLPINYVLNGTPGENIDYIYSEIYFCPQGLSYAPIYAKTQSVNTVLLLGQQGANVVNTSLEYSVLYNQNTYSIEGESTQTSSQTVVKTPINKQVEYTFRTVVDNAELLFLVRNNVLQTGAQGLIKVVAFNQEEPKDLVFTNAKKNNLPVNLRYNGNQIDTLTLSEYEYCLNEANTAGMNQYYLLQEKVENTAYNSLMVKYISPVLEFNGLSCLGSLVYELTEVQITIPEA